MAQFTINQVRHLFVVRDFKPTPVEETDDVGTISIGQNADGDVYFMYRGAAGVGRTDYIKRDHILRATSTHSENLRRYLKEFTITLDPNINGGIPVAGQEYILGILFREYIGLSPEEQLYKNASVFGRINMTPAQFYTELAEAITNSFSPIEQELITVEATAAGVTLREVKQPWVRGLMESVPVNFNLFVKRILVNGDELPWGVIEQNLNKSTLEYVENGEVIADMEYFYMGERGDFYRNMGFPRIIPTTYLISNVDQGYSTIDIHFYWDGNNGDVQKSERTMTFVCDDFTTLNTLINALNPILEGLNFKVTVPVIVAP